MALERKYMIPTIFIFSNSLAFSSAGLKIGTPLFGCPWYKPLVGMLFNSDEKYQ